MTFSYKINSKLIEEFAAEFWNKKSIHSKTYYCLPTFPYPSASGLHVGHPLGYVAGDVFSRFMHLKGCRVLQPFGFDSFGLPAEQHAIKTGQHPRVTTEQNIQNFIKQLKVIGLNFDWDRMISTCDPSYYKWTQWIFLQMYDNFFDPTEIWDDGFGHKLVGKAKPIVKLVEYLKQGTWHLDSEGVPKPGPSNASYTEEEIKKSLDKSRLAYLGEAEVNWCPGLGTVLANEEVTKDRKSERGNFPVERKIMKQWMLRITAYADRLSDGLETVDWPEKTVTMQKNWIGKSVGMNITFKAKDNINVFTTRSDTIMGVTFLCVSQDCPVYGIKLPESEEKIGKFTGYYATHPITNAQIPIWVGNYVLSSYGTGAVMGVPAHDQRDFEFAKKYNLPILPAIVPPKDWLENHIAHNHPDVVEAWLKNPADFTEAFTDIGEILPIAGLAFVNQSEVMEYLENNKFGKIQCTYRLRDWVFNRQRYWGEPIPVVYDAHGNIYALDESELPLILPEQIDFTPNTNSAIPTPPLSRCQDWIKVKGIIKDGKVFTKCIDESQSTTFFREASTMPNWAGSSWYYLRYLDPHNDKQIIGQDAINEWAAGKYATVDTYIIGNEHTVLHLLYARFWHMFLFDIGCIPNPEPWERLFHQGMITADAYLDEREQYVDVADVVLDKSANTATQKSTGKFLTIVKGKMGKSYKNGVLPEEVCEKYSTDVFRLHLMYMAPVEQTREWNQGPIVGMERFCQSVCNVVFKAISNPVKSDPRIFTKLNIVMKLVEEHYTNFHMNTAISSMIELCNMVDENISIQDCVSFLILLAPCAPHLTEFLYQEIKKSHNLYNSYSIFDLSWPNYDASVINAELIKVPVQINNKVKMILELARDIKDHEIEDHIVHKLNLQDLDGYKVIIIRKDSILRTVNLVDHKT